MSRQLTDAVAVIAVLRSVDSRPEPPASWALVTDTGHGWHLNPYAENRLREYGYDADLGQYTLYVVPQGEYNPRDAGVLRVGKARNDVVHMARDCDEGLVIAARRTAGRWRARPAWS
ncbi:hypothetical protein [Nonomuraea sp. NPDC003754]